jgi:putative DNA primase/helicase
MTTGVRYRDDWSIADALDHAPRFQRFLEEVTSGDEELALFYVRWFGYSLFGHSLATKFLILSGKLGFNGKGAIKRLMLHVMGDYAVELDQGFYERKRFTPGANEARADLLKLKGVRAAFISEPTGSFNTEVLKNHTGGDRITARDLHRGSKDIQSWQATHTITFLTNDIPPVSDVGLAVVDRVMVADFREHFTGSDPDKPGYKDEKLDAALQAEGEAVLRILVHAAVTWHEDLLMGRKGLEPIPQRVLAASKSYMDSNDAIGPFLDEACRLGDDEKVAPQVLYDAYKDWYAKSSGEGDPMSLQSFGAAVGKRFTKAGRPPTWRGLAPLGAMALAERE